MAADDMATKIKQSTVVLTEFGRTAVVLYFEMGKTPLPVVMVKGKKNLAERIVDIAKTHDVPIFEDSDLTRKLFENCQQDNYITRDLIEPMALILRKVMGMDDK
jgi:type III secretion protein U